LIAKFNRRDDDYNVGRWEGVAMKIGKAAGINVAEWGLEEVGGRTIVTLRRFDRDGDVRIRFVQR
jgi:serine/threonine-protein kinase HipA